MLNPYPPLINLPIEHRIQRSLSRKRLRPCSNLIWLLVMIHRPGEWTSPIHRPPFPRQNSGDLPAGIDPSNMFPLGAHIFTGFQCQFLRFQILRVAGGIARELCFHKKMFTTPPLSPLPNPAVTLDAFRPLFFPLADRALVLRSVSGRD